MQPTSRGASDARSQVIDALRGVAALGVVGFHAHLLAAAATTPGLARSVVATLDIGVELFFVLSGLLISAPFVRALVDGTPAPNLGRYALRRAMRILPAYWALLLCLFLFFGVHRAGWEWLVNAALMQSAVPSEIGRVILPVAWTLHVEILFYMLVPLAYLLLRRRAPIRPQALAVGILAVWALSTLFLVAASVSTSGRMGRLLNFSVMANVGLFCPGILLALVGTRVGAASSVGAAWQRLMRWRGLPLPMAALAVLSVYLSGATNLALQDVRRPFEAMLCWLVVGVALDRGPRLARAARWLAPIGTVSYSLYLWHWPLMARMLADGKGPGGHAGVLRFPLAAVELAAIALPIAALSYMLVERPAMRRSHGRGRTSAPPRVVSAPASARATLR